MKSILLLVLALAVGCGDGTTKQARDHEAITKNAARLMGGLTIDQAMKADQDHIKWQKENDPHDTSRWWFELDTIPDKPAPRQAAQYVTRDSFIVRYDTTGWEKEDTLVSMDSVEHCEISRAWVIVDTSTYWEKVPKYESRWVPVVRPAYAPKIVVQLTPDEHKRLMEILTAENGQHD